MAIEKYRVHEVAKDFGLPTKTITEILTKYAETPKNHMQALTDQELSLIFEYLTQHNQVSSIQTIFADTYQEPAKEAKKAEPAKAAQPAQGQGGKPAQSAPAKQQPQQGTVAKPAVQQPVSRVPQKKIVDTRKGGDVNLAKYDERLEDLGGERGARMQRQQRSGKEKIRTNNQRRGGMTFSNKRRQDEAERMRKLQLEIAKKAPVKVMIPESLPSLVANVTIATTTIMSYGAMAGIIGGGGLGKIAINYGYNRYNYAVMLIATILIVILVTIFQALGSYLANRMDHRITKTTPKSKKHHPEKAGFQ